MTKVKITRPFQRLSALIDLPGGRTVPAAVSASEQAVGEIKGDIVGVVRLKLHDISEALGLAGSAASEDLAAVTRRREAYRKANDVYGLANFVDFGAVGDVMLALCDFLHDAGDDGVLHPLALNVYRRCAARLQTLPSPQSIGDIASGLRSLNAACTASEKEPQAGPFCRFVYASLSHERGEAFDLTTTAILAQSVQRNREQNLTGILVADDGCYLQCIEGDPETVGAVAEKLMFDPRHRAIRVIAARSAPSRRFPNWSVCFHRISEIDESVLAQTRGKLNALKLSELEALSLLATIESTIRTARPRTSR